MKFNENQKFTAFVTLFLVVVIVASVILANIICSMIEEHKEKNHVQIETIDDFGDRHEYLECQFNDTTIYLQHYSHCKYCSIDSIKNKLGVLQGRVSKDTIPNVNK